MKYILFVILLFFSFGVYSQCPGGPGTECKDMDNCNADHPDCPRCTPCDELPIVLKEFNAVDKTNFIEIYWIVESEVNNDYFELLRSIDLINKDIVCSIYGRGTTSVGFTYVYKDYFPRSNSSVYYYELIQYDYDGKYTYYDPIVVYVIKQKLIKYYDIYGREVYNKSNYSIYINKGNKIICIY